MRGMILGLIAAFGVAAVPPAHARDNDKTRYEYDGRVYETRAQCLKAKKDAKKKGAIIGAVGGGATGALLGGNVGESALAAGAGALAGAVIGNKTKKC